MMDFIAKNIRWIAIVAIAVLALYLVLLILGVLSRAALIDSIQKHIEGKPADFRIGLKVARRYFWRIFFISVGAGLFVISSAIVLFSPVVFLFMNSSYFTGVFMAFLAVLIMIPIVVLAVYIRIYGYMYAVLGQLNFWDSIENAYNLFRRNMYQSIIMGIIFFPIGILLAIATIMIVIPIVILFVGIGLLAYLIAAKSGAIAIFIAAIIVVVAMVLALRSLYEAFSQAVWVNFFHAIAKSEEPEAALAPDPEPTAMAKAMPAIKSEE
jgi:hypothetical protein